MQSLDDSKKIFSSFYIIGCDYSNLQKYIDENNNKDSSLQFIQNIDLLISDFCPNKIKIQKNNEKWIKLIKGSNTWFRIQYTKEYNSPITELKFVECNHDNQYILFPKSFIDKGYKPIVIYNFLKKELNMNVNSLPVSKEFGISKINNNENFVKIPLYLNAKTYMQLTSKKSCVVPAVTRTYSILPFKDIYITHNTQNNFYQLKFHKHKSPFSFKYMPKILDNYPPEEEPNSSIALFCFPEGIKISEEYSMPKWFNFILTNQLGERTYATILYFKEELDSDKKAFKKFIPFYKENNKSYFIEKGICILAKYPFYHNSKLFLKELYRIAFGSGTKIPLERIICNFVDSLYLHSYDKILRYNINELTLDFYQISSYGFKLDTNNNYFELLFRIIDFNIIIIAWKCLLLEKKLILKSESKSTLFQVANALINLLFPFIWNHIIIPILPEKMKLFIESPVPSLIGISFQINPEEIPKDALVLNIDKNYLENYNSENYLPLLPQKLHNKLEKSLIKIKEKYLDEFPINVKEYINYQDEVLPHYELDKIPQMDILEIRDAFYNIFIHIFKNYQKFMIFNKKSKNITEMKENENQVIFLKDTFLKCNDALDNDFLKMFLDTSLFTQFIDCFNPDEDEVQKSMVIFLESIKNGRGTNKLYFQNIKIDEIEYAQKVEISDLNNKMFFYSGFKKLDKDLFIHYNAPKIPYKSKFFYYKDEWCYNLKVLKKKDWQKYFFFIIHDIWFTFFSYILNFYEDNQAVILMDYALSLIEDIIITKKIPPTRNIFSKIIKSLGRNVLNPFMKHILKIVNQVYKNKGNNLFQNDYLNGMYTLSSTEDFNSNINIENPILKKHVRSKSDIMFQSELNNKNMKKKYKEIESYLRNIIFLTSDICPNCFINRQITKKLTPEEILTGFYYNYEYNNSLNYNEGNYTICINCFTLFQPKIYYFEKNQNNLFPKEINLLSPMNLMKSIDNIFSEKGENYFYRINNDINNNIYLNIIFYFELFDLPLCVLFVQNDMDKFEKIKNKLKGNLERKNIIKRNNKKNDFYKTFTSNNWKELKNNLNIIKDDDMNIVQESEINLWKNIQAKILENKNINIKENEIQNEDKNDIIIFIKELKEYIKDSLNFFNKNSQIKLYKYFLNYEKNKEKSVINIAISDESNDKTNNSTKYIDKNRLFSTEIQRNKKISDE